MSLVRRLLGSSLLIRFAVVSLVVTVAVGGVLASVLSAVIEDRARQQAEDASLMAVRLMAVEQMTELLTRVGTIHDEQVSAGS